MARVNLTKKALAIYCTSIVSTFFRSNLRVNVQFQLHVVFQRDYQGLQAISSVKQEKECRV